ncbi:hypothetical protein [Cellulomonas iranensis]|uniref:hypothetical protein n=1 Tax=Cellulomonas iranensis TaxID=76862 RepID=UPI0013D73FC0|nr:hypothetical protein [Cellulomonas iranensis]
MAARLTGFVHVTHPENGDVVAFGPDDRVPGWAKGLITNPAAWSEDPAAEPERRPATKKRAANTARDDADATAEDAVPRGAAADAGSAPQDASGDAGADPDDAAAEEQETPQGDDGEPAKPRGNGARDAWAKWADSLGVTYDEDATRDEIKAAVEAAQAQA